MTERQNQPHRGSHSLSLFSYRPTHTLNQELLIACILDTSLTSLRGVEKTRLLRWVQAMGMFVRRPTGDHKECSCYPVAVRVEIPPRRYGSHVATPAVAF